MLTSNGPEKMPQMDQKQLEEVPQDVSVGVRVIAAMSRYGPYQDSGGMRDSFLEGINCRANTAAVQPFCVCVKNRVSVWRVGVKSLYSFFSFLMYTVVTCLDWIESSFRS